MFVKIEYTYTRNQAIQLISVVGFHTLEGKNFSHCLIGNL